MKLNKKKITFLLSGKGSNLLKILKKNIKKNIFQTYSIVSNNLISIEIKKFIKINKLDITIYENSNNILAKMVKEADIIFSVGYMKKIDKKLINNFNIINLHPSILPKYKGLMTQKRMLINNEKYYGFSIHKVTPLLDDGEVLSSKSRPIKGYNEMELKNAHKILEHQYVFEELVKYLN